MDFSRCMRQLDTIYMYTVHVEVEEGCPPCAKILVQSEFLLKGRAWFNHRYLHSLKYLWFNAISQTESVKFSCGKKLS